MTDIRGEIISGLQSAIKDLASQGDALRSYEVVLQTPKEEGHGDYASNIAMIAFGGSRVADSGSKFKTPMELAEKITEFFISHLSTFTFLGKVEAVKPGFINFWISKEYLISQLGKTPQRQPITGRKIMVEFTDPNPFKEFHIGHLYSNTVGESVSRLLESLGANVKRANYQGDVGLHVAKAIYSIIEFDKEQFENLKTEDSIIKKIHFLGLKYADGAHIYDNDEKAKVKINDINRRIYLQNDPQVNGVYREGKKWSLEYFETIYKRLGTKFDFYYFESEVGKDGLELVKEYLKKGIFEESQGAVIFPGKKYGLHDRVFINSLGLPTYEAKELGLAPRKYEDFPYDQSIVITGNEIIAYFKVLLAALGKINPDLASKTKHLPHGMVRLPTGKMSSRTGNVLTGEWLLNDTKKLLREKFSEMEDDVLEKVTVGSVKYALLKSSIGHDIEFDLEESINIQGNSGPYLQYTFARTQSVLAKSKDFSQKNLETPKQIESAELSLLRALNRFPEVVEEAGKNYAPNLLCNYLFDLAQKFNLFYQKCKIIGSEQESFRLNLTAGVGQVLKNGLGLLGIQSPEKM